MKVRHMQASEQVAVVGRSPVYRGRSPLQSTTTRPSPDESSVGRARRGRHRSGRSGCRARVATTTTAPVHRSRSSSSPKMYSPGCSERAAFSSALRPPLLHGRPIATPGLTDMKLLR